MHLSFVEGKLVVAVKGLKGRCPHCNSTVIAKCGDLRKDHWSHQSNKNCDSWQTGKETEWHLKWKEAVGLEYAEKKITKGNVFHIADILIPGSKEENDLIIEFQNSPISKEEILEREDFYGEALIWVINGTELGNKFYYDKNFYEEIFDKWEHLPKCDHYTLDDLPSIKQSAYLLEIPYLKYDPDYEKFIFSEGFLKHEATFQRNNEMLKEGLPSSYIELRYYKPFYDATWEDRYHYIDVFKSKARSYAMKTLLNRKSVKTRYIWKYARLAFNYSRRPVFIDLNEKELFLLKEDCVDGQCLGTLFKKDYFLSRIKDKILESYES